MISEEDFESESVEAEVITPSNELAVIIKETQLEPALAQEFTINFEEHFRMASEWAKKAKKIIVTDASQQVVMQEARTARLFLREKRIEIEKFRVSRKEYFLKGGRAIDKVANFLKDTIIPIEEHLDRQEHFVENLKKAEEARVLAEFHAKQEAEIKAKEEADRVALAEANKENARLKKEADEKEKLAKDEINRLMKAHQEETAKKNSEIFKAQAELMEKRQAEIKAEQERIKAEQELKSGSDIAKIQKFLIDLQMVKFPDVTGNGERGLITGVKDLMNVATARLENYLKTNINEEE